MEQLLGKDTGGILRMKKKKNPVRWLFCRFLLCLVLLTGFFCGSRLAEKWNGSESLAAEGVDSIVRSGPGYFGEDGELHGVWISYLTWNSLPKEEQAFQAAVDQMFDHCKSWGMNAVFVHVRSHGDAMYPSDYAPWSKFASGIQGKSPGYDPLSYMIQSARARGLKFHAWFNPYRITGYQMTWDEVSADSRG